MTYYILDLDRSQDLCVWWGPNCRGYTTDIERAGVYTADELKPWMRNAIDTLAVPSAQALADSRRVVPFDRAILRELEAVT